MDVAEPTEAEIDAVIAVFDGDLRAALHAVLHDLAILALDRALTVRAANISNSTAFSSGPSVGRGR